MKKQMTAYVYWRADTYSQEGGYFSIFNCAGMSDVDSSLSPITSVDIEFEMADDFDPRSALVDSLLAEKKKLIDEATEKAAAIDEKVKQLLAISHEEEA